MKRNFLIVGILTLSLLGTFTVPTVSAQTAPGCYTNDERRTYQGMPDANGSCAKYPDSSLMSSSGRPGAPVDNGLSYTPLEPIPGQSSSQPNFCELLNILFKVLIYLGGMVAVLFLVLGGIAYMVSEVVDKRSAARERIKSSVIGLLILLSSYLILFTVNPNLVNACNLISPTTTGVISATPDPATSLVAGCTSNGGRIYLYSNCADLIKYQAPGKTCENISTNMYCVK
ncbi:pilin [Patescibacteria group bacterium]|nr:pilin [Patescibacteria group bacterium]